MKFEELKIQIIESTKKALGTDAPENWDYLTEKYILEKATEEDESLIRSNVKGILAEVYGHNAYLGSDNYWYFQRNINDSSPAGGCGSDKRKWNCNAVKVGACSLHDNKYKFYN